MPIKDEKLWKSWEDSNKDPYGNACIQVAHRVMEILDTEPGPFDANKLILRADKEMKVGGITGFMAGAAASMISQCHSRGEEFRASWNHETQIGNEGDKATKRKQTLNPALLRIGTK